MNKQILPFLYLATGVWIAAFLEGFCWTRTGVRIMGSADGDRRPQKRPRIDNSEAEPASNILGKKKEKEKELLHVDDDNKGSNVGVAVYSSASTRFASPPRRPDDKDGKRFRTRSSEFVRLVDLLDEAKNRSKQELIDRGREDEWTAEELENVAEAIGYGAVKYADLKNNRLTNYTFNFDQMLDVRGNTAVYLLYAHARICSIIRKSGKDIEELKKIVLIAVQPLVVLCFYT